MVGSRKKEIGS